MQGKDARWVGVITLFVIMAISYIDRINIAVLVTDAGFLDHFGLSLEDHASQGMLGTAFMVGYALSNFILTPFCATVLGVRRSLFYGLVFWGVVTATSPSFSGMGMLLLSRVLLGISEGPLFGLASSYIKAHFRGDENGKPNSLVNMGTGLGLAIGFPLVSTLVAMLNWHASFYVLGLINIAIGLPLVLLYVRMPERPDYRRAPVSMARAMAVVSQNFRNALHTRYLVTLALLTSACLAYLWGSASWLPSYLKIARGFSVSEMGWLGSLPQYAIVLGVLVGGVIIDRIKRRHVPLIFVVGSIGIAASVLLAIYASNKYVAVYSLIAAGFFWGLQTPPIPSTVQYYSKPEHVAAAIGFTNGTGALTSAFMPLLMGWVIGLFPAGHQAGFQAGFGLLVGTQVVVLVCGALLWARERRRAHELGSTALAEGVA
ncbi:MFS transporter [Dyella caseinilytica]|uniref:MFS transporter n=2 Tax=Dyella caseinilytica TaxID=1849581 RepID=A0ABX7H1F3_9GAMM|nr:MFS transporter [Dyella caseinilytica]